MPNMKDESSSERPIVRSADMTSPPPSNGTFVEALPLTSLGKTDKKALRRQYWAESDRQIN